MTRICGINLVPMDKERAMLAGILSIGFLLLSSSGVSDRHGLVLNVHQDIM